MQKSYDEIESLEQTSPDESRCPLGLFDELQSKLPVSALPLESLVDLGESSSSLDNPFFEEFMDLDKLFPDLPLVDSLNMEFDVEQALSVVPSDICQSDVVTLETESTEPASPCSEIIDMVLLESDLEVPSPGGSVYDEALSPESIIDIVTIDEGSINIPSPGDSVSDEPLSPESIIDIVTIDEGSINIPSPGDSVSDEPLSPESISDVATMDDDSVSEEPVTVLLNCDQDESTIQPVTEEITIIHTSDPLTLLTQELANSFSLPQVSELTPSTLTVDLDELFSFPVSLGLSDCAVLPGIADSTESMVDLSEVAVKAKPRPKRRRTCSSERSNIPSKKAKHDGLDVNSCHEQLDKRTVRRLKNNVASKHARASRKQRELELFQKEEELEKSNAELRKQLKELELLTCSLRKVLVEKLSGVNCPL